MNINSWSSTVNNLITFCFSSQVAYISHRFVTFSNPDNLKLHTSFFKFITQSLTNIGLSSLFSLIVVDYFKYHYYSLIVFNVTVLPFISYSMMRLWVFQSKGSNETAS